MAWKAQDLMSLRQEFVTQARAEGANVRALCRAYDISPKTGYKWLHRSREGEGGPGASASPSPLGERSRRPHASPRRTPPEVEARVLGARSAHPTWGGRKLRAFLLAQERDREGEPGHGEDPEDPLGVPSAGTITAILRRHGRIGPRVPRPPAPVGRFERERPNELWQMDFKGHFPLAGGGRCHPLTVIDDHSRFLLGVWACADEQAQTVRECLEAAFGHYGLPEGVLCDNGSPWGDAADSPHTILTAWLWRLGVKVIHGRPRHPQTQGKDERLHRTLGEELLSRHTFSDLTESQRALDEWRRTYNTVRPHEALDDQTPAKHYQPSARPFPDELPPLAYLEGDTLRQVDASGKISWEGRPVRVGRAFGGQLVALRPTTDPHRYGIYYGSLAVRELHREPHPEVDTS